LFNLSINHHIPLAVSIKRGGKIMWTLASDGLSADNNIGTSITKNQEKISV